MNFPIKPPRIDPWPENEHRRPLWSVMIPTYNARTDYLEETLRSVLREGLGPEEMQIEVVDDCSPAGAPTETVHRVGQGRIALHPEPVNNGLAGTWNRCIQRARGEWVHILHQDDFVLPGFYAALSQASGDGRIGAAFSRNAKTDSRGNWLEVSPLFREPAGILENWHEEITLTNPIRCPAIVVRRAVYEHLGGYLKELCFALDWEMWQRIAAHYAFWFDPAILAAYRTHPGSATSRLNVQADDADDVRKTIDLTMAYHPPDRGRRLAREARRLWASTGLNNARAFFYEGNPQAAWKHIAGALKMSLAWPVLPKIAWLVLLRAKFLILHPGRRSS